MPETTIHIVKLLTKWWSDHNTDIESQKATYYADIKNDFDALGVKILDRADNVAEMTRMAARPDVTNSQRRWFAKYLVKTEHEIVPLVELYASITTPALTKMTEPVIAAFTTAWRAAGAQEITSWR